MLIACDIDSGITEHGRNICMSSLLCDEPGLFQVGEVTIAVAIVVLFRKSLFLKSRLCRAKPVGMSTVVEKEVTNIARDRRTDGQVLYPPLCMPTEVK